MCIKDNSLNYDSWFGFDRIFMFFWFGFGSNIMYFWFGFQIITYLCN